MRVFESNHLTINYYEDRAYFKVTRIGSEEMEEGEYKRLMLKWAEEIEFYKPAYQLVNYMNFRRPIPTHLRQWVNENLIDPAFNTGIKKLAFIISQDFYVQVSLEQIMQEKEGKKFKLKYFDNETDAENWLFEDE